MCPRVVCCAEIPPLPAGKACHHWDAAVVRAPLAAVQATSAAAAQMVQGALGTASPEPVWLLLS